MSQRGLSIAITTTLLLASGAATGMRALDANDDVQAGRKSLQETNYPWYDREADSVRAVNVNVHDEPFDPGNRDSGWQSKPANPNSSNSWFGSASWLGSALRVAMWTGVGLALALIIGGLVWLMIWLFLKREVREEESQGTETPEARSDEERVENLPFKVKRPQSDLLAEARRHYEQGNYREAVIYLFSYQLVQLDKHHIIRLAKGKTNRQYLREVPRASRLNELLETTMYTFEDVFFGDHDLARDEFEECWKSLDDFHHMVQGGAAV